MTAVVASLESCSFVAEAWNRNVVRFFEQGGSLAFRLRTEANWLPSAAWERLATVISQPPPVFRAAFRMLSTQEAKSKLTAFSLERCRSFVITLQLAVASTPSTLTTMSSSSSV